MTKQLKTCQDTIVEINQFSVSDEMLWVTGQTGRRSWLGIQAPNIPACIPSGLLQLPRPHEG